MPRGVSPTTRHILRLLWILPWASSAEVYALLEAWKGIAPSTVPNALRRAQKRGWLLSASLGRERDAVTRWIFSNTGIEWGEAMGWQRDWWHSATGARALARRIQVVEATYQAMVNLFRSNLVSDSRVHVFTSHSDIHERTGETVTRWNLEEAYWAGADVMDFAWVEKGPFDAVIGYGAVAGAGAYGTAVSEDLLYMPICSFGRFHKEAHIDHLRSQMGEILEERRERSSLPISQAVYGDYFPGVLGLCSDGAVAAMVQRHYMETHGQRDHHAALGIMDIQGKKNVRGTVVRPMSRPTSWWDGTKRETRPRVVGDMARMVNLLQRGPYAAVNGRRSWRVFRTMAIRPGSTLTQIAALNGLEDPDARELLEPMVEEKVVLVWRGGYYLDASGRRLFADAERVTAVKVLKQQGEYARPDGRYRRTQRLHNLGTTESVLALQLQGFPVFSALGMSIDYYVHRRLYRVSPDAFIVVDGVLMATEYERSAKTPKAVEKKARPYKLLADIGIPIPVLFITKTDAAAKIFASLGLPHVLATTLYRLKQGPQGRADLDEDGAVAGDPGCWYYWYSGQSTPSTTAPIDLWPRVRPDDYRVWRVGTPRPYSDQSLADWWKNGMPKTDLQLL